MDNVIGLDRLIGPYKPKESKMEVIYNKDNRIIQRSRNMRGIREFVSGRRYFPIKRVTISDTNDGGLLNIVFENGNWYTTEFADFNILKDAIRRWRNLYGAPLVVNGEEAGKVGYYNPALADIDAFTKAYIECALWASTDNNEDPMDDKYTIKDIHPDSLQAMADECRDFQRYAKSQLIRVPGSLQTERNGHDFWLTRNGHGAGFWDRGYGELGDELTRKAKSFGSSDLYVGDDGKIHVT